MKKNNVIYSFGIESFSDWQKVGLTNIGKNESPEEAAIKRMREQSSAASIETIDGYYYREVLPTTDDHDLHFIFENVLGVERWKIPNGRLNLKSLTGKDLYGNVIHQNSIEKETDSLTEYFKLGKEFIHAIDLAIDMDYCNIVKMFPINEKCCSEEIELLFEQNKFFGNGISKEVCNKFLLSFHYLLHLLNSDVKSIDELLSCGEEELFKKIMKMDFNQMKKLIESGFVEKDKLNLNINSFFKVKKFFGASSVNNFESFCGRIKMYQFPLLLNKDEDSVFPSLNFVKPFISQHLISRNNDSDFKIVDMFNKNGIWCACYLEKFVNSSEDKEKTYRKYSNTLITNNQNRDTVEGFLTRKLFYGDYTQKGDGIDEVLNKEHRDYDIVFVGDSDFKNTNWKKELSKKIAVFETSSSINDVCMTLLPSVWRDTGSPFYKNLNSDKIHIDYIKTFDEKECKRLFKKSTRADAIVFRVSSKDDNLTLIEGYSEKRKFNLKEVFPDFLPNDNFEEIKSLISEDPKKRWNFLTHNSKYATFRPDQLVVPEQTDEHFVPIIMTAKIIGDEIVFRKNWAKIEYPDVKIPKVIVTGERYPYVFIDESGEYGYGTHCFAVKISSKQEGQDIRKAIHSKRFRELNEAMKWKTSQTSWKFFSMLSSDWYKKFI